MDSNALKKYKKLIQQRLIKGRRYRNPDYSAAKLAKDIDVDVRILSALMKDCYGMSYPELVLKHRIDDVCTMMQDELYDEYGVEELALMVGFKNRQSFFTAFKRYKGTTPSEWRKSEIKNQFAIRIS